MARQNIDDIFWLEVTAVATHRKVDPDKLAGNAQRFFRYAQEKYKLGKRITHLEFESLGFMPELVPMFAKKTDEGIRAGGESEYFGWLDELASTNSKAGKISAQRPRDEKGRLLPNADPADVQRTSNGHPAHPTESSEVQRNSSSSLIEEEESELETPPKRTRKPAIEFKPQTWAELMAGMKPAKQALWSELYPDAEYIAKESKLAFSHYHDDHPEDEPGSVAAWSRALSWWLKKGWPDHQRGLKTNHKLVSVKSQKSNRWDALAGRMLDAVKQFSAGDEKIAQFVGNDWDWISKSRLMPMIRATKANEFGRKGLARDLKDAFERSQSTSAATA